MSFRQGVQILCLTVTLPASLVAQARFTFSNSRLVSGDAPVRVIDPATGQCVQPVGEPWHLQLMAAPISAPADSMETVEPLLNFIGAERPGYVRDRNIDLLNGVAGQLENIWVRVVRGTDPSNVEVVAVAGPFAVLPQTVYDYSIISLPLNGLDFCAPGVFVAACGRPFPDAITVNEGDTVTWEATCGGAMVRSYTEGWSSPRLNPGEKFSYIFRRPGNYVYRVETDDPTIAAPGLIRVKPISGNKPGISILTPVDHFIVPGYVGVQAVVTNAPLTVQNVNFYAGDQLIGSARTPPYFVVAEQKPGTYQIRASVVNTAGQTNTSAPITVTFESGHARPFQLWRLPEGQTVFFVSAAGGPFCFEWSDDLKEWKPRVWRQRLSDSIFLDETTTNVVRRYYRMRQCL